MIRKWWPFLAVIPVFAVAIALVVWRGPDWGTVRDAFTVVSWTWVVTAIGLNLLSVLARSVAWDAAIEQSVDPPQPAYPLVFSAFCVGLFANAVLPGRVGELARVAVLRRRMARRKGTTATLIGSVFAHRMFDLPPTVTLVVWVVIAAKIPQWALGSVAAAVVVGLVLFAVALVLARRQHRDIGELGRMRLLFDRGRQGLAVMRRPLPALKAASFQYIGWGCQLFAVWAAMRAFHIHQPLAAAGLVLVLMNVVTIVSFWPGNIGLVQVAVATSLVNYGVDYGRGIAYGIGLQAIEASVGIGVGLIFLAREGLSYATLKAMDEPAEENADSPSRGREPEHAGTRVPG